MPDAEIIYVVSEIINEIPALRNKRIVMKLNHVSLLESILLHFGIKDNHQEVYEKLSNVKVTISSQKSSFYICDCDLILAKENIEGPNPELFHQSWIVRF